MKERFIKFLKRHSALTAFKDAFNNLRSQPDMWSWDEYFNNTAPVIYIGAAFNWERTDEGFSFWSQLENKWFKIDGVVKFS